MKPITLTLALAIASSAAADTIPVDSFRHFGPLMVAPPAVIDSLDVNSKPFSPSSILDCHFNPSAALGSAPLTAAASLPASQKGALNILSFTAENRSFARPSLSIDGVTDFRLTVDNSPATPGEITLKPGTHTLTIAYLADSAGTPPAVSIIGDPSALRLNPGKKLFAMDNVLHGTRIYSTDISPDGRYLITIYSSTNPGGAVSWKWVVSSVRGNRITTSFQPLAWMPGHGARFYSVEDTPDGRTIHLTDAPTGATSVFASGIPQGNFTITPDEKSLIITSTAQGPKEDPDIYRIIEPEDRQPGWRNRSNISVYDLATGLLRPLTHSSHNVNLLDISDDSRTLLVSIPSSRLTARPTTLFTIATIDIPTGALDTIVADDGFIGGAIFAPDKNSILLSGSPEALGGIGKNLPEGRIPSMIDTQLFLWKAEGPITPLTRGFNPNVTNYALSRADGKVYFTAENRDKVDLFTLELPSGKITLVPTGQDLVKNFTLPASGTTAAFTAQSADNPDRLYTLDTRRLSPTLIEEPLTEALATTELSTVHPWSFLTSRGDSIHGRFYLPPGFDPSRKYPLIVNYYGGCSPTSRNFESRYPHHAYAAQDYVVYVIQPSGATGFGQEFSSRHVKTAGKGVADDIIEGTREFCRTHPYVDATKIGCIGASYGGFMTQYLQTVTDIFAAAISHAGISDHASYWGEGYWGYSYSEVSMGDSYPWTDPDLYVRQSPLFNADKIHTPLLFLHGDSDTNVPVGESIQMFTALKLLGRPTAFVAVAGQDHHIMDYNKRIKWQDTIFAWFEKYLKGDSSWWDSLYPPVQL